MLKTIGYILLVISSLSFLSILIVPWIGFSKIQIAGITTGLIIAGEILFYLSLIILGKSFWEKIKSKLRFWKVKPKAHDLPEEKDITINDGKLWSRLTKEEQEELLQSDLESEDPKNLISHSVIQKKHSKWL